MKSAKIHLVDTGLAAHLIGYTRKTLANDSTRFGHLLESFVVGELRKQATWSETRVGIYHYRTAAGQEVDIVLENGVAGSLVGIEVKASATVTNNDFSGLRALAEVAGDRFKRGIVLYTGEHAVSFGSNRLALPISSLWRLGDCRT